MKQYLLWGLVFLTYGSNPLETSKPSTRSILCIDTKSHLSKDYQLLNDFGAIEMQYQVSEEDFQTFFWKGVSASIDFYHTHQGNRRIVQNIIKQDLLQHSDLRHRLKKPRLCETNLEHASEALNQFSGNWYGQWAGDNVNHLWLPVTLTDTLVNNQLRLLGFQSCYTGDGLGWNYIVENNEETVVLGYVYHFEEGILTAENPHYAYCNTEHQLTWVSNDNIYYEFTHSDPSTPNEKQYVITGASYTESKKELKSLSGFQAVYSSKKKTTPVFQHLVLDPLKQAKNSFASTLVRKLKKMLSF
ncbi:MAG: hypothetical protein AAFU57_17785 [Bacteroidota bacterium]